MNASQPTEALQPTSGWVAVGLIAILLLAATVTGSGDYTRELEAERDQLRERVEQLEVAASINDVCYAAIAQQEGRP